MVDIQNTMVILVSILSYFKKSKENIILLATRRGSQNPARHLVKKLNVGICLSLVYGHTYF